MKHFPRYWPFVRGIPSQRPVTRSFEVLHLNKRLKIHRLTWDTGSLRRYRSHYNVTVMHNTKFDYINVWTSCIFNGKISKCSHSHWTVTVFYQLLPHRIRPKYFDPELGPPWSELPSLCLYFTYAISFMLFHNCMHIGSHGFAVLCFLLLYYQFLWFDVAFLNTALCEGNQLVTYVRGIPRSAVDSPHKGSVIRSFDALFFVSMNKLLNCRLADGLRRPDAPVTTLLYIGYILSLHKQEFTNAS